MTACKTGTNDVTLQYKLHHFRTSEKPNMVNKCNMLINVSLVENTGNISLETCKSYKQTSTFTTSLNQRLFNIDSTLYAKWVIPV